MSIGDPHNLSKTTAAFIHKTVATIYVINVIHKFIVRIFNSTYENSSSIIPRKKYVPSGQQAKILF